MKHYFVIHSECPYLLARLCTELQMEGYRRYVGFDKDPFEPEYEYLHFEEDDFTIRNHDLCPITPPENRLTLTEENYLSVLTHIIESND